MDEPEGQLRFVGRLQAVHDSILSAIAKVPDGDRHVLNLLGIARDATHKAVMEAWTQAPSLPNSGENHGPQQP